VTFESTLPLGEPELMRVSAFERYLDELRRESGDASLTRLSSLNPSLLQCSKSSPPACATRGRWQSICNAACASCR
jgi:hypothetical protein